MRMKSVVFRVCDAVGITRFAAWCTRKQVKILCYHGVTERTIRSPHDRFGLQVRQDRFATHLDYLQRRFRVISLEEYLTARREGRRLPEYAVVLTFDDGYRNFLTAVAPRLTERQFPVTMFLITDRMRNTSTVTTTPQWTPQDDETCLSWEEVRDLTRSCGVVFGSHTCSHAKLPELSSTDRVHELRDSYNAFAQHHLPSNAVSLAYPYGAYSKAIAAQARVAGYTCALTTEEGVNGEATELFALRRILIGDDDDLPAFAARVSGLTWWFRCLRAWLRPVRHRVTQTPGTRPSVLYISYDGALEPLGESQVVAYLQRLAASYDITLMSFEKVTDWRRRERVNELRTRLRASGITWIPLGYHRYPHVVSTAYDVFRGWWRGRRWRRGNAGGVVHARGYVAALIAWWLARRAETKFLFDMRGFWADEKVEAGHWSAHSWIYAMTKRWERRFFESADAIVSLTQAGVRAFSGRGYILRSEAFIEVIPTCVDLTRFVPGPRDAALESQLRLRDQVVIGCTGTMSNWYLRTAMLEYLAYFVRELGRASILIVTREDHERLRADARAAGIANERLVLVRAPFEEMPNYLRLMDIGLFFIQPHFSKKGSAATKLAEFLACGVPVIINEGVGDSDRIVRKGQVGVVLSETTADAYRASLPEVQALLRDPLTKQRCRETARRYFDVEEGSKRYARLYDRLLQSSRASQPSNAALEEQPPVASVDSLALVSNAQ